MEKLQLKYSIDREEAVKAGAIEHGTELALAADTQVVLAQLTAEERTWLATRRNGYAQSYPIDSTFALKTPVYSVEALTEAVRAAYTAAMEYERVCVVDAAKNLGEFLSGDRSYMSDSDIARLTPEQRASYDERVKVNEAAEKARQAEYNAQRAAYNAACEAENLAKAAAAEKAREAREVEARRIIAEMAHELPTNIVRAASEGREVAGVLITELTNQMRKRIRDCVGVFIEHVYEWDDHAVKDATPRTDVPSRRAYDTLDALKKLALDQQYPALQVTEVRYDIERLTLRGHGVRTAANVYMQTPLHDWDFYALAEDLPDSDEE